MNRNKWGEQIVTLTVAQREALNDLSGETRGTDEAHAVLAHMHTATRHSLIRRGYADTEGLTGAGYDVLIRSC